MQESTRTVKWSGVCANAIGARSGAEEWRRVVRALCAAIAFAVLTAAAAQIRIPIPGTPVPVTLQTLVVVLAGMTLGSTFGTLSMVFYVLLGLTGYNVFATGPQAGMWLPPTAGYLLGFVLAQPVIAFVSGWWRLFGHECEPVVRWVDSVSSAIVGHGIIFVLGIAWLAMAMNLGAMAAIERGLLPFVPGTILKVLIAAAIARKCSPAIRRWIRG